MNLGLQGDLPTQEAFEAQGPEEARLTTVQADLEQRAAPTGPNQERSERDEQDKEEKRVRSGHWTGRVALLSVVGLALIAGVAATAWHLAGHDVPVVGLHPFPFGDREAMPTSASEIPNPPGETASSRVVFEDITRSQEVEPTRFILSSGASSPFILRDLSWSNWGSASTAARGTLRYSNCKPACSIGINATARATVQLSGIDRSCGEARYRRLTLQTDVFPTEQFHMSCSGRATGMSQSGEPAGSGATKEVGPCVDFVYGEWTVTEIEPSEITCGRAAEVIRLYLDKQAANGDVGDGWTCMNYGASGPLVCDSAREGNLLFRASLPARY